MDNELVRVWHLINELSDQLAHNYKITKTLQSQSSVLKNESAQISSAGFNLRRFNTDITKEAFDSELERSNAQMLIENQALLHENKQLSLLLKEYEGTLETIMTKFRNHTLAAQQHELTLTRHYETLLLARDTQDLSSDFTSAINMPKSLHRLLLYLRNFIRSTSGEENLDPPDSDNSGYLDPGELVFLIESLERRLTSDDDEYSETGLSSDWQVDREHEIARLEEENNELRKALGIDPEAISSAGIDMAAEFRRMECERHPILSLDKHRRRGSEQSYGSGDHWVEKGLGGPQQPGNMGSYWDGIVRGPVSNQQQQPTYSSVLVGGGGGGPQQLPAVSGGAPLQRAVDLPGMRMGAGAQGRRLGSSIPPQRGGWMGAPPTRGGVTGIGGVHPPPPSTGLSLWNQPSPAPPITNRPQWPTQGSGLDIGR
ncbi:hypothetical protein E1B28_001656 [Marasmius oreades]|uniref:EF-hand domain-containing protein n=1 Tax=Marasmius oreades TaxID=181124 RepID=A0A9P7V3U8_9AGAR|nr:uncharacterized protein E1B28_001656 [Marasmius oreades]KAG7099849.1 hypothetical protein E1B28_001656 [Marasmius oreades]